jgi:hypothetical protein
VPRLTAEDVACWVLKSTRPPALLAPGWRPGTTRTLRRCVRPSYRLALMTPGTPVLLWVSGRDRPGVHALGELTGPVRNAGDGPDGDSGGHDSGAQDSGGEGTDGPAVEVRLTALADPVARAELLADPAARDAEVLRMPAGSNPSWLSARQYAAVLART